ncbi:MAG: DUF1294 domain-containing protein [Planctomycetes bacterium]|nr:DUF1294 domain-containing protein [Planctomycetota bacterium]
MAKFFILYNFAVFLAVGLDKFLAGHSRRRISEASLLIVAALGAAPGLWAGMLLFRHKTRKSLFLAGAVLALATSIAILVMTHGAAL